jgi:prepilin-type N-terminal cleavage/methylation domain-containing protein
MKRSSLHNLSTRRATRSFARTPRGFTLIEIMVVLAIAAVVTGITVSGFKSLTENHRRTTCQANMSQLYASLRLYGADHDSKFPYYDPRTTTEGEKGIGLWALYTFPRVSTPAKDDDNDYPAKRNNGNPAQDKPIELYLRNAKVLHCPADDADTHETLYQMPDPDDDQAPYDPNAINLKYLSYQFFDNGTPSDTTDDEYLYQPIRTNDWGPSATSTQREDWKRQLLHYHDADNDNVNERNEFVARPPASDTVVTWCPWHRGSRDFDTVLFYDGSIQVLPREKDGKTGWRREPNALK